MAAITWASPTNLQSYAPIYKSAKSRAGATDELERVPGSSSSEASVSEHISRPSALQRLVWRNLLLVNAAQELLLLTMVGISSTALAFAVDKSIDFISHYRTLARHEAEGFLSAYLTWTGSSLALCGLSAACVQFIGPNAAGSGIPQMKCVLAGVQIHDYLSVRTLVAKASSLVFALSGGLSIGKEGPYVHMASCIAHQLCQLPIFRRLAQNEHLRAQVCTAPSVASPAASQSVPLPQACMHVLTRRFDLASHARQVLSAACAAGVSATFGAPVGGVLFSIEVTSTFYSISHLWKAMYTSVCGALLFRVSREYGSLALFHLTKFSLQVCAPRSNRKRPMPVPRGCKPRACEEEA